MVLGVKEMNFREKQKLYSAKEQLYEDCPNKKTTNFDYFVTNELLEDSDINRKIYQKVEKTIIDNIDKYANKQLEDISKISILIKAIEKELKEESSIDKVYLDQTIESTSFSEYYSVDLEGLSRLYDLLKYKRKEIINESVESVVINNSEDIIKKIIDNKEIKNIIKEKAEKLLDFDFFITSEKEEIEEIKKDSFYDDQEKKESIEFSQKFIDYTKKLSANKEKMIKEYQDDVFYEKLCSIINYGFESNKTILKILENKIVNDKSNNYFKIDPEEVVDYYCNIEKELYRDCNIIPESDAIEHLVKLFLDKNYNKKEEISEEIYYFNQQAHEEMLANMSNSEYYDYLDQEKRKRRNVEFFKVIDSDNGKAKNEYLAHVKVTEGGFDYYLITPLSDGTIFDVEKIKNVLKFIGENNYLKIEKFDYKNNKKIYNELLNTLWNYINKNKYYSFYKNNNYILNKKLNNSNY